MKIKNFTLKLLVLFFLFGVISVNSQIDSTLVKKEKFVYHYNNKLDIPLTSVAAAITIFNFTQIYNKDRTSEETILALDKADVNRFDRGVAGNYSESAKSTSDVFFNLAIPLPLITFYVDKSMRKDYGKLALLYLEAMSFTGVLYSSSQQFNDRFRPLAYSPIASMAERSKGGSKNSFYSGHTSLVATSTFFLARVYHDYHPDSPYKWVFYGGAGLSTVLTAHFRVKGGAHFPTDVIVGGILGSAAGFLVPFFHKNKMIKNEKVSLMPFAGEYNGLQFTYTF